MCRLPTTPKQDPAGLHSSLAVSPLLAVLRPNCSTQAEQQVAAVAAAGFRHVELSWNAEPWWFDLLLDLQRQWPLLRFGAAAIREPEQLQVIAALGLTYAMAPIATEPLLQLAQQLGITLVPGVFSPTEIHHFGSVCSAASGLVKLFPAAALGPTYWRQLQGPLAPLPFCIAAGGIAPKDLASWFAAGVQAVALGSSLFDSSNCLRPGHIDSLAPFAVAKPNRN